jgi:hypothetical protein
MNKIKIFLVIAATFITCISSAQQTKPKIKTITLVAYHPIRTGSDGHAAFYAMDYSIRFYQNDSLHYTANNYTPIKPFEEPKKFRFGMSDTTYRIPEKLTSGINKIFDGKTPLKSHMITDKLPEGSDGYNDLVYFITYKTYSTTDTFIAVPPFLDKKLKNFLDQINLLPRGKIWILKKIYHDNDLENMVKDFEKTCSYVPAPTPPKVSQLEIADPGVKH